MNWSYYLAEANLYLAVFYLAYCLLFSRETHYQLNRTYLLFSCMAAFALPVLQVGILKPAAKPVFETTYAVPANLLPEAPLHLQVKAGHHSNQLQPAASQLRQQTLKQRSIMVADMHLSASVEKPLTIADYLWYIYLAGAGVLFMILVVRLVALLRLTRRRPRVSFGKYQVIQLPKTNIAFSFFGYLFLGDNTPATNTIIEHELVHIRQKHSADIIFLELLKIINWFNPCIYLLQNSLKTVHEYIADEHAASLETDTLTYATFLVSTAHGIGGSPITHSFFNYNLLKKRIIMLNQKRSGNSARLIYLITAPICALLLCVSTLAFTKNYKWIDLDPAKAAHELNHSIASHKPTKLRQQQKAQKNAAQQLQSTVNKITNTQQAMAAARPGKSGVTIKGFKFQETAFLIWNSQNLPDVNYQVVITDKNGQKKKFVENRNGERSVMLWEKYGYAFPQPKALDPIQDERISNVCVSGSTNPSVPAFYRPSPNTRPIVYLQVDSGEYDLNHKRLTYYRPIGLHPIFLVNGKVYTKTEMENQSAKIQLKGGPQNLVSAERIIYHPEQDKETIEKYGPIAQDGIYEFVNVHSSKLN